MSDQEQPGGDAFGKLHQEAADLAREMGQPGAGPGPGEPGAGDPGQTPPVNNARDLQMAFELVRAMPWVKSKFPTLHGAMGDEEIRASAEAMGAVFDKYGWSLGDLLARFGVEIKAAMVVGSWAWAMGQAAAVDIQRLREKQAHQEPQPQPAAPEPKRPPAANYERAADGAIVIK